MKEVKIGKDGVEIWKMEKEGEDREDREDGEDREDRLEARR